MLLPHLESYKIEIELYASLLVVVVVESGVLSQQAHLHDTLQQQISWIYLYATRSMHILQPLQKYFIYCERTDVENFIHFSLYTIQSYKMEALINFFRSFFFFLKKEKHTVILLQGNFFDAIQIPFGTI